jgi:hypothetical protein
MSLTISQNRGPTFYQPTSVAFNIKPEKNTSKINAQSISLTSKSELSKTEAASWQSLGGALVTFAFDRGYKASNGKNKEYVVYDMGAKNALVVIPPNPPKGQNLSVFVFGEKNQPNNSIQASFTPDGILRLGRNATSLKDVVSIKGASLDFSKGIEIENMLVKLSNGKLVKMISLLKK